MKHSILSFLILILQYSSYAQCNSYYNFKNGARMEMETYNAKDKKTGKVVNFVKNFNEGANQYEAAIESKTYDAKDKEQSTGEYTITCNNGVVSLDLKSLIPQESFKAYENMDVTFSGEHLEIPQTLSVGDRLKDGLLSGEVKDKKSDAVFSTFEFIISDRNVDGKEMITTPAGSFDCYKVSYNMAMNTRMMGINIPISFKGIEYIAEKVGVVKSETYNKNGKLTGYTLITRIE